MKNARVALGIVGVVLILCLILAVYSLKPQKLIRGEFPVKYNKFETTNPALDFTFEYPESGWVPAETRGSVEKYDQVYLRGPVEAKTKFTTLIHITVRPREGGKSASDLIKEYQKTDSNLLKYRASGEKALMVGGEKAVALSYEYETIPSYDISVPPAPFKAERVFVVRNDRSYEFTINTFASQFDAYAPILTHLLETFRFKDQA